MPVIVYKTMTIELFYAQGRRITCDSCQQPFVYIHGGVETAQTTGVPVVSSDDGMRKTALKQAIKSLRKTAKKEKAGEGLCPHCHCYQGWMVRASHMGNMGCFFALGAGLLTLGPLILNAIFDWTDEWGTMLLGGLVIGGVLGLIIGKITAITVGPHPDEEDARSMTDDEFEDFLGKCDEEDLDAFLLWWITVGNEPGDKQAPVSIGLEDTTGMPEFPEDLSTDYVIAREMDGDDR